MVALVSKPLARCLLAGALGASWHLGAAGIACSPCILVLWRHTQSRIEAGSVATLYYAGGVLPALWGVYATGYADLSGFELAAMACVATLLMGGLWTTLWSRCLRTASVQTGLRVILLLGITALPGLGIIGLQHPLTAAGLYFPGSGWIGLLGIALIACFFPHRLPERTAALLALAGFFVCCSHARPFVAAPPGIAAHSTRLAIPSDLHDYYRQALVAISAQETLRDKSLANADIVVLPEGIGGLWTSEMKSLWYDDRKRGTPTVVLGATLSVGDRFDNVVLAISELGTAHVPQRVPMPGVMWRPWRAIDTYRPHWLSNGILALPHHRLGVVVCYEQMIVFPVLWSIASGADTLIGLSNLSTFPGETLVRWQRDALHSWGALFEIPVAVAMNTAL